MPCASYQWSSALHSNPSARRTNARPFNFRQRPLPWVLRNLSSSRMLFPTAMISIFSIALIISKNFTVNDAIIRKYFQVFWIIGSVLILCCWKFIATSFTAWHEIRIPTRAFQRPSQNGLSLELIGSSRWAQRRWNALIILAFNLTTPWTTWLSAETILI